MRKTDAILKSRRGVSLAFVAILMVVLLGMAALAVDVGMLDNAKAQAQNAADSGALAGAGSLIMTPNDSTTATAVAETFAEQHVIVKDSVVIVPIEDIQVDLANSRVTVTARRILARNNAVPTFFARVLGFDLVDVEATAVAEVGPAGSAACLKPWAIPDAYDDLVAPPDEFTNPGDYYESGVTSYGTTYRGPDMDWGLQLTLKHSSPGDAITPGQFFPIDLPLPGDGPIVGGDKYRENIATCNTQIVQVGDILLTENGNMIGPTQQGVNDLIAQDPIATWDSVQGVMNSNFAPGASPRLVRVPMFDPRYPPDPGKQELVVTNIAGFFIESMGPGGRVTGRLMPTLGTGGPTPANMLNTVRLVE